MNILSRYFQLASRYVETPGALKVKLIGGIPGTFWKLNHPWFHALNLQAAIDIGANEGQFSQTIRSLLREAHIFAFEPIPERYRRAQRKFKADPKFKAFNLALGDRVGVAHITVASGDTGASSLLAVGEAQREYFPHTLNGRKIDIAVDTLDRAMSREKLLAPYLLKIDVQAYEHQFIQGGKTTLGNADLVVLEASYEPFYEGQKLFEDIYSLLRDSGFRFVDSFNMMYSPGAGRALQGDFIFSKSR